MNQALCKTPEQYFQQHQNALQNPNAFWLEQATQLLSWDQVPQNSFTATSTDVNPGTWFADGALNLSYNCLDRHVLAGRGDQVALWICNETDQPESLSYAQLLDQVHQVTAGLQALGLQKGDRVITYLPLCAEQAIWMLACSRLGLIHSVVYAGFSADALRERIEDAQAKLLVAATGTTRSGQWIDFTQVVSDALQASAHTIECLVTHHRHSEPPASQFHLSSTIRQMDTLTVRVANTTTTPLSVSSTTPLFILYTSGTTGKPKGIMHSTGGYATYAAFTTRNNFELEPGKVMWSTADAGWITGHSYTIYGPLLCGATTILYEGSPLAENATIFYRLVDQLSVHCLYTAPTIIRMLRKTAPQGPDSFSLKSLNILGSVGEPLNPAAWQWYFEAVGKRRVPIIDTWWQTETGGHLIGGFPQLTQTPGVTGFANIGIAAGLCDAHGKLIEETAAKGDLVITQPWPGMLIGCWNNSERFKNYWHSYSNKTWFATGDMAQRSADGRYTVLGRSDDVIKVGGVRLGSSEIESALIKHPLVAEAGVVSTADELMGEKVVAFVVLRKDTPLTHEQLRDELRQTVRERLTHIAQPSIIHVVKDLPKTRSGKIKRRILREHALTGKLDQVGEEA